jgi:hypothetical protein
VLTAIASPSARLYVEPQALFAAHHESYNATLAMTILRAILRAIARGNHRWSAIAEAAGVSSTNLGKPLERLIGDLGLVERVLPVTEMRESRAYFTQYHLTDNLLRFRFRFIESNQGHIEFGDGERVVDTMLAQLPEYVGLPFEAICRDWVRLASAAHALPVGVGRVGTWWNPDHQIDVVGLDDASQVAIAGECKWQNHPFGWDDLKRYLGHVRDLGDHLRNDVWHLLFSRSGFSDSVRRWATTNQARVLDPADLLAPFPRRPSMSAGAAEEVSPQP